LQMPWPRQQQDWPHGKDTAGEEAGGGGGGGGGLGSPPTPSAAEAGEPRQQQQQAWPHGTATAGERTGQPWQWAAPSSWKVVRGTCDGCRRSTEGGHTALRHRMHYHSDNCRQLSTWQRGILQARVCRSTAAAVGAIVGEGLQAYTHV
jgi:hypothetical protein